MSTLPERAADARHTERAMLLAANGNPEAMEYMRIFAQSIRLIDDIEDGDNPPVDAGFLAHLVLVALPRNPFLARYAAHLIPAHDIAINAWQDANELPPEDRLTVFWADLVNEVAQVVAGITGGYAYRRKVSMEIRQLLYRNGAEKSDPASMETPSRSALSSNLVTPHP